MAKDAKGTLLEQTQALSEIEQPWQHLVDEVLGVEGIIRQAHNTTKALSQYKQSDEYREICKAIALAARKRNNCKVETQVVTLRLPIGLHAALKAESHDHHTTLQKLCFALLLQHIDPDLIPLDE